jgi:hypothetical protein
MNKYTTLLIMMLTRSSVVCKRKYMKYPIYVASQLTSNQIKTRRRKKESVTQHTTKTRHTHTL